MAADHREHVEAGQRLALHQGREVVAVDLDGAGRLDGDGRGQMRRGRQHRGQAEDLAGAGGVDHDFLVVLVDDDHLHLTLDDDEGLPPGVADLVDPLARRELAQLDLLGQDRPLVGVQQGEDRDLFEHRGVAGHRRTSRLPSCPSAR